MEEPLHTVQGAYRALGRGDLLTFLSVLHELVEWHHPLGPRPVVHQGQVAIVQNVLDRPTGSSPGYSPDRFLAGPDHVVVLGQVGDRGAARGRFAHIWMFDGPRAAQIHAFEDDGTGKNWGPSLGPAGSGADILTDHLTNGGESWLPRR